MEWSVLALIVLGFVTPTAAAPALIRLDDEFQVESWGSRLTVFREAPVAFSTLDEMTTALAQPLGARARAASLVRSSPPQAVDYVLGVTREGTLIVGEQVFDLEGDRPFFVRGEIWRAYAPLQRPGPWTWLVAIPVSREATAVLELKAATATWPVTRVTITPSRTP